MDEENKIVDAEIIEETPTENVEEAPIEPTTDEVVE